jgi:hypothetical protein
MMPSFPDRPLLPSTPQAGVIANPWAPPPPSPAPYQSSRPPPLQQAYAPFTPPPAFPQQQQAQQQAFSRGAYQALSTQSLRAVLFPHDRAKRIFAPSRGRHGGGSTGRTQPTAPVATRETPPPPATTTTTVASSGKTGFLTVMCKPDACDHVVDGSRDLGGSPLYRQEMTSGKHVLTLRVDSTHVQKIVTVEVPEGDNVTIKPTVP